MKIEPIYYKEDDTEPSLYKLNDVLNNQSCNLIHDYYYTNRLLTIEDHLDNLDIPENTKTYACYCDCLGITILQSLTERISNILGRQVLPSYSYTRVYQHGTRLIPHRDRKSCEVSLSITLKNIPDNNKIEHFYVASESDYLDNKHLKTHLSTGDGLLFFGSELNNGFYHWRDRTDSDYLMQIFLHYVYEDGQFTDNAYEWIEK